MVRRRGEEDRGRVGRHGNVDFYGKTQKPSQAASQCDEKHQIVLLERTLSTAKSENQTGK